MTVAPVAVISIAMSSCAAKRSRALRGAPGSGSRCCRTAGSPRGLARGTPPLPDRPCHRRSPRRSASGRSSASWQRWRWRAQQQQRDLNRPARGETER
jgi:hypothetical protein